MCVRVCVGMCGGHFRNVRTMAGPHNLLGLELGLGLDHLLGNR